MRGGPDQRFGGVDVCRTAVEAESLFLRIRQCPGPYGLDTETVDINPRTQSPVLRGRVVVWSVAWTEPGAPLHGLARVPLARRAILWASCLPVFAAWLADPDVPKVLQNAPYDCHVLENMGYPVRGVVGDTKYESRLWYSSKDVSHGLKDQAKAVLGYEMAEYAELFSKAVQLKSKFYKRTGYVRSKNATWPVLVGAGEVSQFSGKERELIALDRLEIDYPERLDALIDYASLDAKATLELHHYRVRQLASRPAKYGTTLELYDQIWQPGINMLTRMERSGIRVDPELCAAGKAAADADVSQLTAELAELTPFTGWGSPVQLQAYLFGSLGLPRPPVQGTVKAIKATRRDQWATAEASLSWLEVKCPEQRPVLSRLRQLRKAKKYGQYLRDLPKYIASDGRVHTVLSPETDTGRLAARNPALQQIPGSDPYGIRKCFTAADGYSLVVADYSQLEVYVLAHVLLRLFNIDSVYSALRSGDVYTWIARTCWPTETKAFADADFKSKGHPAAKYRGLAKILVLATNYGKTPMGLALQLLDETGEPAEESYCRDLLDTYLGRMDGVVRYQEWIAAFARKHGYTPTLLGRRRPIPLAGSDVRWEAARGARQALNSPIQGGAMDIALLAMLGLNTYPAIDSSRQWFSAALAETKARCLLQIHDELIFEAPANAAPTALGIIKHGMENPPVLDLAVQLRVEAKIAHSWAEGK